MMKRFLCGLVAMGFMALVTGCNTIEGMGQDVKSAGNGIERSAEKHKSY
jgi:predicted small secreted protein